MQTTATLNTPEPVEPMVTLTMPLSVAKTLHVLTLSIGGDPAGFRGDTDQIRDALSKAGVTSIDHSVIDYGARSGNNAIYLRSR